MKKLMFAIVLFVLVLSCVACDNSGNVPSPVETQNAIVKTIGDNPIASTANRLVDGMNHETGIAINAPCKDGCADEIINELKKIGK